MVRGLVLVITCVLLSVLASVATVRFFSPATLRAEAKSSHSADNRPPEPGRVVALAKIEPRSGVVQLSAPPGDRVRDINVTEGETVKKGQVLVVLDSQPLREAEEQLAASALDMAKKLLPHQLKTAEEQELEAVAARNLAESQKLDLKSQEQKVVQLEAIAAQAKHDYERLAKLDDSVVSPQSREKQRLVSLQAQTELEVAQQAIVKARATADDQFKIASARVELAKSARERIATGVEIENLQRQHALAVAKLEMSLVRSPSDGVVLQLLMREGESTGAVPILRMAQLNRMACVAEVYETDAHLVHAGQTAKITADALVDPQTHEAVEMTGKVDFVGSMVARNEVHSLDPTDRSDARVVRVRIEIDERFRELAARWINLQAKAEIATSAEGPAVAGKGTRADKSLVNP